MDSLVWFGLFFQEWNYFSNLNTMNQNPTYTTLPTQPYLHNLTYTTFDGRQTLMETTLDGRQILMEDNLGWKTKYDGRRPLIEDNL